MERCFLGKEQIWPVQRQITINLIRRHLMIALDAILAASIHQHSCPLYIGFQKYIRIVNGTIHMTFSGKIYHHIRLLCFKQFIYCFTVTDIRLYKQKFWIGHSRLQCGKIACIGKLVQTDNPIIRMGLQHMKNKIAANKSGTASNNNSHFVSFHLFFLSS